MSYATLIYWCLIECLLLYALVRTLTLHSQSLNLLIQQLLIDESRFNIPPAGLYKNARNAKIRIYFVTCGIFLIVISCQWAIFTSRILSWTLRFVSGVVEH